MALKISFARCGSRFSRLSLADSRPLARTEAGLLTAINLSLQEPLGGAVSAEAGLGHDRVSRGLFWVCPSLVLSG